MRPIFQPKLSVLVPVYNGEEYLAECLESILIQDYPDFELLISDNASTDGTPQIIQQFVRQDSRIRAWRNPENLGMVGNFNRCMSEAKGTYLKFVLADDKLVNPAALQTMVDVLEQNPVVSLLACASQLIDERSRLIGSRNHFGKTGFWDGKQTILNCLERKSDNIIGEPTLTLFRKSQSSRGFDLKYRHSLDIEMWYHLLEQGQFAFWEEPLCAFRIHPNQTTQFNRKMKIGADEQLSILETYMSREWLREKATPQLCVVQVRKLRNLRNTPAWAKAQVMVRELKRLAGPFRYARQCLKYALSRPLQNFDRHARRIIRKWRRSQA